MVELPPSSCLLVDWLGHFGWFAYLAYLILLCVCNDGAEIDI